MRIEKVNSTIKRELGMILQYGELSDPRISFVTIMSVDTSKDLQHARVKFSVLSDDPRDIEAATQAFVDCRGLIRKLIGQRISLRYTPQFQFVYDKSIKYAADIDKALEDIKKLKSAPEGA
ncbi:MAG: 30S ribosome-binding factor RbfA [Candidatus Omnitrophica bacterium]|nr:30S ribosome-binding factor RbfA [Candidatus Omnitrophota bacterium]MDE2221860.1 30S ribosome-binding factor RbfA [Candidatus Omnitrophota bacterium]